MGLPRSCNSSQKGSATFAKELQPRARCWPIGRQANQTTEEVGPITTDAFIDLLEQRDLLEAGMIKRLRRQIAEAPKPVSAVALARRLVEQGHLTRAQARRLLAAGGGAASQPSEPAKPAPSATPPAADREEDLGLAPLDDASEKPAASSADDLDEDLGLAPLDDEPPKKPAKKPTPKPAARRASSAKTPADAKPSKPAGAKPSKPTGAKPAATPAGGSSLFDEELPALDDDLGGLDGGPLDGLLADSTLDADTAAGGSPLAPLAPKKKGFFSRLFAKKKKPAAQKTNVWDSPLLLIGGGTLLVLLILVTVLVWAVSRQSGEDAFRQADEDYAAGSYAQAIHKFDIALEKFPNHPAASLARVHRGLSRLRQVTPRGTSNWTTALETAKAVIDEIRSEDEFPQAKPDLSAMLLAIANGLAGQAQQKLDPKLVAQAEETIELLKKYVPKELRNAVRLAEVEALLATTVREIERDDRRDILERIGRQIHREGGAHGLSRVCRHGHSPVDVPGIAVTIADEVTDATYLQEGHAIESAHMGGRGSLHGLGQRPPVTAEHGRLRIQSRDL